VTRQHHNPQAHTPAKPPQGPGHQRSTTDPPSPLQRPQPRIIDDERPLRAAFEVTLVDGERGRQLALVQARAIREVLTWWATHNTPQIPSTLPDAA
jgi:hypothetical protein